MESFEQQSSDALADAVKAATDEYMRRGNFVQRAARRILARFGFVKAPRFTVEATVIRKDGTIEPLGVVGEGRVEFRTEGG